MERLVRMQLDLWTWNAVTCAEVRFTQTSEWRTAVRRKGKNGFQILQEEKVSRRRFVRSNIEYLASHNEPISVLEQDCPQTPEEKKNKQTTTTKHNKIITKIMQIETKGLEKVWKRFY